MRSVVRFGSGLVILGLILVFCSDETYTIYDLRFEDGAISGWIENTEKGYVKFTSTDMFGLVNGGAKLFIDKGMNEGFAQYMHKDEKLFESWIMDFGTADKAKVMYDDRLNFYENEEDAGSYSQDMAFVRPDGYGYTGFAIFGNLMIYITLSEYGTNKSEAKNNMIEFFQTYDKKIQELGL